MRIEDWHLVFPYGFVQMTGSDGCTTDFDVYSFSQKGYIYDVRIDWNTLQYKCDCDDATYRRHRRTAPIKKNISGMGCKHIQRVHSILLGLKVFNNEES